MSKPSAYADLTIIVCGAVDAEDRFYDETLLRDRLAGIEAEAAADGQPTEVFVLYHEHPESDECGCSEYLQDHRPLMAFNVED